MIVLRPRRSAFGRHTREVLHEHAPAGRSLGARQIGRNVTSVWAARPSRGGAARAGWRAMDSAAGLLSDRSRSNSVMGATGS